MLISLLTLLSAPVFAAEPPAIEPALVAPKKPNWDPKGKAMELYLQARIQMKKEAWHEAADLYVQSLAKQPGCGKCLNELTYVLTSAQRYDAADQVGQNMATLYADKTEGWLNVFEARNEASNYAGAIEACENVIRIDADETRAWAGRTLAYVSLGQTDEALAALKGAEGAGLAKEDVACHEVLVITATGDLDLARERYSVCETSKDAEIKRLAEGWLALSEGDVERASKALMRTGANNATRLAIAIGRYDEKKFEASTNLTTRIQEDLTEKNRMAWDADVAHARGLAAMGKSDEALQVLAKTVLASGWEAAHAAPPAGAVLLPSKGKGWGKEQGHLALQLQISVLVAQGKADEAKAWYDKAVAVHGKTDALDAALVPQPPAMADAPAAPAPAPK
jgi:tetratricopeptide (TPR) repeat protein